MNILSHFLLSYDPLIIIIITVTLLGIGSFFVLGKEQVIDILYGGFIFFVLSSILFCEYEVKNDTFRLKAEFAKESITIIKETNVKSSSYTYENNEFKRNYDIVSKEKKVFCKNINGAECVDSLMKLDKNQLDEIFVKATKEELDIKSYAQNK